MPPSLLIHFLVYSSLTGLQDTASQGVGVKVSEGISRLGVFELSPNTLDSVSEHLIIIIIFICQHLLCSMHCVKCFRLVFSFNFQAKQRAITSPHFTEEKTEMLKKLPGSHSSEMVGPRFKTRSKDFKAFITTRLHQPLLAVRQSQKALRGTLYLGDIYILISCLLMRLQ